MSAVEYSVTDHVATITLNRPEAMNAVNGELATGLGEALAQANADDAVRVVVLTGEGRAFCAGADLKAIAKGEDIGAAGHPEWGFAGFVQHWSDKPVIAAVNGFAMGGGTELALACDLVVAAESAKFGLPEVRRGLIAAAGGLLRIQHQVSPKRAMELALVGEAIDASTAMEWGLVNRVVPDGQALPAAAELAGAIAANAPFAVRQTKRLLHQTRAAANDWDPEWFGQDPWAVNNEESMKVFTHPDAIEGPMAFAEKRDPRWRG